MTKPTVLFVWRTRDGQRHEFDLVDAPACRDAVRRFAAETFPSETTRLHAWRAIVERAAILGFSRCDGYALDPAMPAHDAFYLDGACVECGEPPATHPTPIVATRAS